MEIRILASGSKANCYHIDDGRSEMLIECGLPIKKIKEGLNFNTSYIDACIVSHEHKDHVKSFSDLNDLSIDTWLPSEMFDNIKKMHHRNHFYHSLQKFHCISFDIFPFPINHDVPCYGFIIVSRHSDEKIVYATDTYFLNHTFVGVDYYMIECSYSARILNENVQYGLSNTLYAERLKKSHFELENVKEFFKKTDTEKTKQIYLLHLSEQNSDAKLFEDEIKKITGKPVCVCI